MTALEPFRVALTLCFTPGHLGLEDHHTSPPQNNQDFAEFAAWAVHRYAPNNPGKRPQAQPEPEETAVTL